MSNPESYPALARVGISTRDAIAIVNRGGTTASDV